MWGPFSYFGAGGTTAKAELFSSDQFLVKILNLIEFLPGTNFVASNLSFVFRAAGLIVLASSTHWWPACPMGTSAARYRKYLEVKILSYR